MKKHWFHAIILTLLCTLPALAQDHGGAHAEAASPSLFAGTVAQSLAAVIVFLILFALLYKAAWGPILKGLQEREARIKADIESAETAAQQAQATLEEYQQQLAQARAQAGQIMDSARREAEHLAYTLREQAQTEIEAGKKRAQAEIGYAKEQALNEIYARTAEIAAAIAGKILQREINAADQQRLVQDSLAVMKKDNFN